MDIDEALHSIGDFGRGQLLVFLAVCLTSQMFPSWVIFGITFLGALPDHFCNIPLDASIEENIPLVQTDGEYMFDSCTQYADLGGPDNSTIPCQNGWTYSETPYVTTIVTEWDLVCDRAELVALSQSILMVGTIVGALIFGHISDRIGRRPVLMISLFSQGCLGVALSLSPNYWFFLVVRFLSGIFDQGYELPGFSLISEMFTPRKRPIGFIIFISFWGLGILTFATLAFFIRDWRYLQLAISVPFILLVILCWFIIPESPRWLVSVGKIQEANKILTKLARLNGCKIDKIDLSPKSFGDFGIDNKSFVDSETQEEVKNVKDEMTGTHIDDRVTTAQETRSDTVTTVSLHVARNKVNESNDDDNKNPKSTTDQSFSFLYLFKTRRMFLVTTVLCATWFAVCFVYYGILLNSVTLAGNPYLNLFLVGAIEFPAHLVGMALSVRFGRVRPISVFLIVSSVVCVATGFIPKETASGTDLTAAIVTSAVAGKFFVDIVYSIVSLYTTEVLPTVVRNKGTGVVFMSARIASLLPPFVLLLNEVHHNLPIIIFGSVAALPSLAVLLLPETNRRRQPETLEDIDLIFEEKKMKIKMKKTRHDDSCPGLKS